LRVWAKPWIQGGKPGGAEELLGCGLKQGSRQKVPLFLGWGVHPFFCEAAGAAVPADFCHSILLSKFYLKERSDQPTGLTTRTLNVATSLWDILPWKRGIQE